MTKRLPDIFEDLRQALFGKGKDLNLQESAVHAYGAMTQELKNLGGDTLSKTAQQFNEALPYIERAGYDVTEVEVALGLSPKVVPHLKLRELIDEAEQQVLLEETKGKTLINTILSSLFRASAARRKLNFKRFHFEEIELEIGLIPGVVLKFRPNNEHVEAEAIDLIATK
ncbi:hypothetical protein [Kordiimonas sp. SCSIO 12610]|uniref:hypothetical protein n=1 Tax=Kordiimonas sp. SCSIO 12610 TaxID=2829597 RepID=UPI00210A8243|nr:hypothetical protein [Kordiimonas sp. SCSIO 12610]UTW55244.1 hypothetical protein KFF44_15790 [Kordiimonas sp. SCSIO 12610]